MHRIHVKVTRKLSSHTNEGVTVGCQIFNFVDMPYLTVSTHSAIGTDAPFRATL